MTYYYAGIDYHKAYSVVCVVDEQGRKVLEDRVDHRRPARFEQLFGNLDRPCKVVYESCSNWGWLHERLERIEQIASLRMANAYQVRIIAEAQIKTDRLDAYKLATLLRADLIPACHIPDAAMRARKELLRQRAFWVQQRTKVRNRIHRIIDRQHDLAMPQVSDLFGKKGLAALAKAQLGPRDRLLLDQNLALHRQLAELVKQDEDEIRKDGRQDPRVDLLMSLPGVGLILGNLLACEIDGIERFRTPERFLSYAGLVPSTHSSGGKTSQGRLIQGCNKWLRWAFVEAAWVAVGCSPYFGGYYRHARARGKNAQKAILMTAHRMAWIAYRMLKQNRSYQERTPVSNSPVALVED